MIQHLNNCFNFINVVKLNILLNKAFKLISGGSPQNPATYYYSNHNIKKTFLEFVLPVSTPMQHI